MTKSKELIAYTMGHYKNALNVLPWYTTNVICESVLAQFFICIAVDGNPVVLNIFIKVYK